MKDAVIREAPRDGESNGRGVAVDAAVDAGAVTRRGAVKDAGAKDAGAAVSAVDAAMVGGVAAVATVAVAVAVDEAATAGAVDHAVDRAEDHVAVGSTQPHLPTISRRWLKAERLVGISVSCGDMVVISTRSEADSEGAFIAYSSHEWIGMGRWRCGGLDKCEARVGWGREMMSDSRLCVRKKPVAAGGEQLPHQ